MQTNVWDFLICTAPVWGFVVCFRIFAFVILES